MANRQPKSITPSYDVCLSFAGEDRSYVDKLARLLQEAGVRTFYDEFEKIQLWGKDLYSHLHDIYQNRAKYCVVFISEHYAKKAWPAHERRSAQSRALTSEIEYLLPVRFDDTEVPGIPDTIGYVDLRTTTPDQLSKIIITKVGPRPRESYCPPVPDRLFKRLKIRGRRQQDFISVIVHQLFGKLELMTVEERGFVYDVFTHSCPAELPENVHIDLSLLRRITGMQNHKIRKIASGVASLGFDHIIRESHNPDDPNDDSGPVLVLEWNNRAIYNPGNHTIIANEVIECVTEGYCAEHGRSMFERLDFGQLATSTRTEDQH